MRYIVFPEFLRPEIISGLPIRWYGLMYLVAFAVTYYLVRYQAREQRISTDQDTVLNLFFWLIVGLLVGARLFAVTIYDATGYYRRHPLQMIVPFARVDGRLVFTGLQGMSYHGGLVGAVISGLIYSFVKKLSTRGWGDMVLTAVPLGYTFGRLGNFINGELYGRVTSVPWGMVFPAAERFSAQEHWVQEYAARVGMDISGLSWVNLPRHPSQLYEAFFEGIVLWLVLWFVLRKRKPFPGFMMGAYVIGYGFIRFFIEYVREPDIGIGYPIRFVPIENPAYQFTLWNFTTGQILCFLMIAGGILSLLLLRGRAVRERNESLQAEQRQRNLRKLRKKKQ